MQEGTRLPWPNSETPTTAIDPVFNKKWMTCLKLVNQKSRRREASVKAASASDIRGNVREREPLSRTISGSEAEAIRYFYAIPPAPLLNTLLGAELISLGDLFEGWAQDDRLDPRTMIELLGWSDGMRILV